MEEELETGNFVPKYKDGKKIYWDDFLKDKGFFDKIQRKFSYYKTRIWHAYYDFVEGCKSLWRWKSVIWKDRTWGNHQIIDILIFKLKIDSDSFEKYDRLEGTPEVVSNMRKVIQLLEAYNKDEYAKELRQAHDEKWGKDEHYFLELESGDFEWKSERDDRLTPAEKEAESIDFKEYTTAADEARRKDLAKAFEIIQNDLERWWD